MMKLPISILYEDNHIIAVNKEAGQIVQGDKTGDMPISEMLKEYIKEKYNKPGNVYVGVPHRLDRPVGGVVLFAKTSKALTRLNEMFKNKQVEKTYLAICSNRPEADKGRLEDYIYRNTKQNKSYIKPKDHIDTKLAILDYEVIQSSDRYHLLKIQLHTGRHHQIRCQLANIACPIRGDLKYGYHRSNANARGISLLSYETSFIHPIKKEEIIIKCPKPNENIWNIWDFNNI